MLIYLTYPGDMGATWGHHHNYLDDRIQIDKMNEC